MLPGKGEDELSTGAEIQGHNLISPCVAVWCDSCRATTGGEKSLGTPSKHRDFPEHLELKCRFLHSQSWFVQCCKAWVSKEGAPRGLSRRRVRPLLLDNLNC